MFLQNSHNDKLQDDDNMKVLDLYDGVDVGIRCIHSLSIIHGVKLSEGYVQMQIL